MGQKQSQQKTTASASLPKKLHDPRLVLEPFERRYSNDLVGYLVKVANHNDGTHHRGIFFPEWRVVFYVQGNSLCVRHQLFNDILSRKITIAASDAKIFLNAYYAFQHYCIKMDEAKDTFKGYLETLDWKV